MSASLPGGNLADNEIGGRLEERQIYDFGPTLFDYLCFKNTLHET